MPLKKDQTKKVYAWEWTAVHPEVYKTHVHSKSHADQPMRPYTSFCGKGERVKGEYYTMADCRKLVAKICKAYGILPPVVKPVAKTYRHASFKGGWCIQLPAWGRNLSVIIHEVAHAIVHRYYPSAGGHDEVFMRVYIELLAKYTSFKKTELVKSAKAAKLEVATAQSCALASKAKYNKSLKKAKAPVVKINT